MKNLLLNNLLDVAEQNKLKWEPYTQDGRTDVEIVRLYSAVDENNNGPAAALLKYNPGAKVSRHIHRGYELIFVIQGVLKNDTGLHHPGDLEICSPRSTHELSTDDGCIFLVVWEQPVIVKGI